jgi:hypothetical protein
MGNSADDIPVAHTPRGGHGETFPAPVLAGCNAPLVAGARDLRGVWQVTEVKVNGAPAPKTHPAYRHVERIERCGDRIVITGGGVVRDMRCDGIVARGVHDVAARDYKTPITVVATYENKVHVLRVGHLLRMKARVRGLDPLVTRRRDGADVTWSYPTFTARLGRVGEPDAR